MGNCEASVPSEPIENEASKPNTVIDRLCELGGDRKEIEKVKKRYPMKISSYYLDLIAEKDDPIWMQAVPAVEELEDTFNVDDPLHEEMCTPVPYLVHKYPDRVLLLVSSKCAMYCRFCTRKRKVGRISQIPLEDIFRAIEYIAEHKEVRDVIVSGGDPLLRTDSELDAILTRLRQIPHLEVIRIGSRVPCVFPKRVTKRLVNVLKKHHPLFMNIHFNHPREITPESSRACGMLADAGILLGSQTVLLQGVNDSPEVMSELMKGLLKIRVKPYYIYQCDLVKGVEHFRTPVETGIDIVKKLQGFTSGLAVPHYVIDGPGGKIPVSPQYVKEIKEDRIIISNYLDEVFVYPGLRLAPRKRTGKKVSRIGLAYNLKRSVPAGSREDLYAEFDDLTTVNAIRGAMEKNGYEVVMLEADQDFTERVKASGVDFVFNIAEGIGGECRESHVPAILEMLKIPYSGSGVLTQALTLTKSRMKEVLRCSNIPTPRYQVFREPSQAVDPSLNYPVIVKPDSEGSSVGITNSSLVFDEASLKEQVRTTLKKYSQPVLVEEFCGGREFTVSLMGNGRPKVLPIVEIIFDHLPDGVHPIDSYEVKWEYDSPDSDIETVQCPAVVEKGLKAQLERTAVDTYRALGCQDLCRMDIRLDDQGRPNVLDVNALPGLIPDPKENSRFPRACFTDGMTYDDIIMNILKSSFKRHGLR